MPKTKPVVEPEAPEDLPEEVVDEVRPPRPTLIFRSKISRDIADQLFAQLDVDGNASYGPDQSEIVITVAPLETKKKKGSDAEAGEKGLVITSQAAKPSYADDARQFKKRVLGREAEAVKSAIEEVYLLALGESQRLMLLAELFDIFERQLCVGDNEEALARIEAIAARTKRTTFYENMRDEEVIAWLDDGRILLDELGPYKKKAVK